MLVAGAGGIGKTTVNVKLSYQYVQSQKNVNAIKCVPTSESLRLYFLNHKLLPVATIEDVFTGREKLELEAASTSVSATELPFGAAVPWLNINSASTFTDPEL